MRIPFEEGPYFLFKNSFPIIAKNFLQTLTLFYSYDWIKDKVYFNINLQLSVFNRYSEMPYFPIKMVNAFISTYLATIISYPMAVVTKEMVLNIYYNYYRLIYGLNQKMVYVLMMEIIDLLQVTFGKNNKYSRYARNYNNYFPGMLKNYASRTFPSMFCAVWLADSFGCFSYWNID